MINKGKDLERVVQLIHASIEADSIVKQDVRLPVIKGHNKNKRWRQCDVVITSGPPYRRTITIFEVQDRNKKVEINDFKGWLGKLDDVGAQHLVCVSRFEFPESIKDEASELGGKVKLITIKDAEPDELPLSFFKSHVTYNDFDITKISGFKIEFSEDEAKINGIFEAAKNILGARQVKYFNDKIFSLDKKSLKSLFVICQDSISDLDKYESGLSRLVFDRTLEPKLYLHVNDKALPIGLRLDFNWKNKNHHYPISILKYEPLDDRSLAWIFEFKAKLKDNPISLKMPLIKKDNHYEISGIIGDDDSKHEISLQIEQEP